MCPDTKSEKTKNIIHLMSDPEGNSKFCFPESPDVSRDENAF